MKFGDGWKVAAIGLGVLLGLNAHGFPKTEKACVDALPTLEKSRDIRFIEFCQFGFLRLWPDTGMEGLVWTSKRLADLQPHSFELVLDYFTLAYSRYAMWKRGGLIQKDPRSITHPIVPDLDVKRVYEDAIDYAFRKFAERKKDLATMQASNLQKLALTLESSANYYEFRFWDYQRDVYARIGALAEGMPAGKAHEFYWRISRLGIARNLEAHGRYAEARAIYSDVLDRFPGHPTATAKVRALTLLLNTD